MGWLLQVFLLNDRELTVSMCGYIDAVVMHLFTWNIVYWTKITYFSLFAVNVQVRSFH